MVLSKDVIDRVYEDFKEPQVPIVLQTLHAMCAMGFNVNPQQVCRSAVYVANGSLVKFISEIVPMVQSDPRDIIDEAERLAGRPGHYFSIPLPEVDRFDEVMYGEVEEMELPPEFYDNL